MAFNARALNKENSQTFNCENTSNRDQPNKRKGCALAETTVANSYNNNQKCKKLFPSGQEDTILCYQDKIYKHIQPVFSSQQVISEQDGTATIEVETNCDRLTIKNTFGFRDVQITKNQTILPVTMCTAPLVSRDADYQRDFLAHFRQRETKFRLKPNYLQQQLEVDHAARALLVNWLVLVINESKFDAETLYLAVSYIDRFLSLIVMSRNRLQLLGITATYIAAKYEETRSPAIKRFAFIGGVTFDTKQIVKMERFLLRTLSYDLHIPTIYAFASAYASLTDMPHLLKFLTFYICELSLLEAEPYLQFLPSQISAASHALARYLLGYQIWSKQLEAVTMYRLEDLKQIFMFLCKTHFHATMLYSGAIQTKFMEERFHQVATISPVHINDFVFDQFVEKYNSFE